MTEKNHTVQLLPSEDLMLQLPDEVIESMKLTPGTKLSLRVKDGVLEISKFKTLEVELDDELFMSLALQAHERDITFNELVQEILEAELLKAEQQTQAPQENQAKV